MEGEEQAEKGNSVLKVTQPVSDKGANKSPLSPARIYRAG